MEETRIRISNETSRARMKVCVLEQAVKFPSTQPPEEILQDTIHLYEETAKYAREQVR